MSTEGAAQEVEVLFAVRGRLALGSGLVPGAVVVRGGRIVEVLQASGGLDLPQTVHEAAIVSAGFIDLQVNGGFGVEVGDSPEAIRHLSRQLPATGVTSFLPTIVSSAAEFYPKACRAFVTAGETAGAVPLGLHLEGPFLSRRGAHRASAIEGASEEIFEPFLAAGVLRLVTLAPDAAGGLDRIRRLRGKGVVVSLGHTDATYDEFIAGLDAGAVMATHLFNAMSGFSHRAPGAVGAALVDDRVTVGLIADGVHCHPASVRLAVKAKGAERVALVTDAMAGAGMVPGVYQLDGRDILVDEMMARLPDGTLAGSSLMLDQAVRNVVEWAGTSVSDACRMASEVPAKVLGLDSKGTLASGKDADLVLLDDTLHVAATFRNGLNVYRREP